MNTKTNSSTKNTLPKITANQEQIIKDIYKFRFIHTYQFQKLFNHKDPTTVQEWLKDLADKRYIATDYKRKDIETNRKPANYFLAPLGRKLLKGQKGFDIDMLEKVYKEKKRKPVFKQGCSDTVEMFLFLQSNKKPTEELKFFTQSNLSKYEYFPDTDFNAYFVLQEGEKIRRYFLHVFKESDPKWLPDEKIKKYITYYEEDFWQENTNNSPFPVILFVLTSDKQKYHVLRYGQAVLQKALTADIQLFIETKDALRTKDPTKLWQKVE